MSHVRTTFKRILNRCSLLKSEKISKLRSDFWDFNKFSMINVFPLYNEHCKIRVLIAIAEFVIRVRMQV